MGSVQTDNSDVAAKVMIRRVGLYMMGGPGECRVLDLFAGAQVMRGLVYQDVGAYLGIDRKDYGLPDMLIGDNRRLLPGVLARRSDFNVFDCDAYVNPWVVVNDLCRLVRAPRFVTIATCGISRGLKDGRSNAFIRSVAGLGDLPDTGLLWRWYDDLVRWALEKSGKNGPKPLTCKRMRSILDTRDAWYYAILWSRAGGRKGRKPQ